MHHAPPATPVGSDVRKKLAETIEKTSVYAVAQQCGLHHRTVQRAASGLPVKGATLQRLTQLSAVTPRVRSAAEFAGYGAFRPPQSRSQRHSWSLESIRSARVDQREGRFSAPVAMAHEMRNDDALFAAYRNRLEPLSSIGVRLQPRRGARGKALCRVADGSVQAPKGVLKALCGTRANHGVAVGHIDRETNKSGTRVDMRLTEWPLEHVRWDSYRETLVTSTREGMTPVDIVHGDGEWLVLQSYSAAPWQQDACVLAGCLVWAAHAEALADWNAGTRSHGLAKMIAEMPEGVPLSLDDGQLTPRAQRMLDMLEAIVTGESDVGLRPHGSTVDYASNKSTAWQIFVELVNNRGRAAERIYNGTDAALGSVGDAPGIDVESLMGVSRTIVETDFEVLVDALNTGLMMPWAALNSGTTVNAPLFSYELPDADKSKRQAQNRESWERLTATVAELRAQGFSVTQELVAELAEQFGVHPVPTLGAPAVEAPSV